MEQVSTVHTLPLSADVAAPEKQEPKTSAKTLSAPERWPWRYVRDQKIETLTIRQLRGEVKRTAKATGFPKLPQEKFVGGQSRYDTAMAVVLSVVLESFTTGKNLYIK